MKFISDAFIIDFQTYTINNILIAYIDIYYQIMYDYMRTYDYVLPHYLFKTIAIRKSYDFSNGYNKPLQ